MATNQYIGARYVPVFADPAEWNNTRTYEPLTIVMHNGNSYTSAQYVPKGIDISNEEFWKLTGNYNAQVEQYRKEVATYDNRITANADAITAETTRAEKAESDLNDSLTDTITNSVETIRKTTKNGMAIVIGNSYTEGVGSQGSDKGTKGMFYYISKLYYKAWSFTEGGIGFGTYSNHSITFDDKVTEASNSTEFDNNEITDIWFISAMGDTRVLATASMTESNYINKIVSTLGNAHQLFPNATLHIALCETIYGRARQDVYSVKYPYYPQRVHYIFKNLVIRGASEFENKLVYHGWLGFNTNQLDGFNYTDSYHPNDTGYVALFTALLNSMQGASPYIRRTVMLVDDDGTEFAKYIAENPDTCRIVLLPTTKYVNTEHKANASFKLGNIMTSSTCPPTIPRMDNVTFKNYLNESYVSYGDNTGWFSWFLDADANSNAIVMGVFETNSIAYTESGHIKGIKCDVTYPTTEGF